MKSGIRACVTFIVAALLSSLPIQVYASHSWGTYHWARVANPFTLQVVDSVTPDWQGELNDTLVEWANSEVLDFADVAGSEDSKVRRRCPMVAGQIRVCNMTYGQNGWLGLATIGIDPNGHIDQGSAKLNDSYDWYFTAAEKNHVMCQEVGHLFGLGHTSEDGSSQSTCMDYSTDPDSQWPNAHDYLQLATIYATTDSYDSYDTGVPDGDSGGGCNPRAKKCNQAARALAEVPPMGVRVNRGRNFEIWIAARNDGGLWIHHVYLAPGAVFNPAH